MVDRRKILAFVREVAEKFSPERVVLFGSYARDNPTADSDVDLLVVMPHDKRNVEQSLDITRRVDRTFPLDLIVRKPGEVRRPRGDSVLDDLMVRVGRIIQAGNFFSPLRFQPSALGQATKTSRRMGSFKSDFPADRLGDLARAAHQLRKPPGCE